ncbi:MetQ/NlpA family ABC transporter substrate-binding protein [Corallococcus sp. CA054B]|uniref:MetQ/NlpA family ABC transporter substrate-binding protein n=1 Tax=Corallococcus sp. CA054B TaxID=2316734 RepID=UPI001F237212|nr:MetQ/NlpA family ABC transporter substrate-binding protein [Corallococcus sp. CA054B]
MVSPLRAAATRHRCTASEAPLVVTKSSAPSAQPHSSERFAGERHLALKSVGAVHLEPLALYSLRFRQLAELPMGAKLSLPADPSNAARALHLLAKQGLLTLREGAGAGATLQDVVGNPRKLDLKEIDAEQQPRTLEDVDGAVIPAF